MKKDNYRKQLRKTLLNQRQAKLDTARYCFDRALEYFNNKCIPGTVYWETECKRALAEAGAVKRVVC